MIRYQGLQKISIFLRMFDCVCPSIDQSSKAFLRLTYQTNNSVLLSGHLPHQPKSSTLQIILNRFLIALIMIVIRLVQSPAKLQYDYPHTPGKNCVEKQLQTSQRTADTLRKWKDGHVENIHSMNPTLKPSLIYPRRLSDAPKDDKTRSKVIVRFNYVSEGVLQFEIGQLKDKQKELELEYEKLKAEKEIYKQKYEKQIEILETNHAELRNKAEEREKELQELRELLQTVLA